MYITHAFGNKVVQWMSIMSKLVFCWDFPRNSPVTHVGVNHSCKLNFLQLHKMPCFWYTSISKLHHFLSFYYTVLKQSMCPILVIYCFDTTRIGCLLAVCCRNISESLRISLLTWEATTSTGRQCWNGRVWVLLIGHTTPVAIMGPHYNPGLLSLRQVTGAHLTIRNP